MPAGILTMKLAATEGLSRETEADVWDPFPCPKPAQMALCIVQVCKHTLILPLLHFYIPLFFFDTRVLTFSDASSSQWPSRLAKANEQPSLKHAMHQELSSHATVIDMSKKIGTNAMFNILSIFLFNPFVSSIFNQSSKQYSIKKSVEEVAKIYNTITRSST
ncbi:hypothetical protein F4703DRAFT_1794835 [Phycomyces blakesleeanus]